LLFHGVTGEQASMAFARACKAVGISDFRYHDLRHTAASWLRMQGVDIHTMARFLGHKDLRMAARYQHLSPKPWAKLWRVWTRFSTFRVTETKGLGEEVATH
jgi:integrase